MRFAVAIALTAFMISPELAAEDVREHVPRTVQVSVGKDHIFGALQVRIEPADLGEKSWARWDRNKSKSLEQSEVRNLIEEARDRNVAILCVSIGGVLIDFSRMAVKLDEPHGRSVSLREAVVFSASGRTEAVLPPGDHFFLLYSLPASVDGIVPVRLRMVAGVDVIRAEGARVELRQTGRLEGVLSRATPALWGQLRRGP